MLPLPSHYSSGSCFLQFDRRNGSMDSLRLVPRKISAHSERTIILAVVLSVVCSIIVLGLIYYIGRCYLSRQNHPSSTDLIIERPIEISSPVKQDFSPSSPDLPRLPHPVFKSPEVVETTQFMIDHPYGHPYAARNPASTAVPSSTIGTTSTTDSSSVGPISIQAMPHPYSFQSRQTKRPENTASADYIRPTYHNDHSHAHFNTPAIETQEQQHYESFMPSPETPRFSTFMEQYTLAKSESGVNPPPPADSEASTTIQRRSRPEGDQEQVVAPTAQYTQSQPTDSPSAYSNDTFLSMSNSLLPIQELRFPQPHFQPHTQFQQ